MRKWSTNKEALSGCLHPFLASLENAVINLQLRAAAAVADTAVAATAAFKTLSAPSSSYEHQQRNMQKM